MEALSPSTLPVDDNVNPYAFCIDLNGEWFMRKGAMIAHYGQIGFEGITAASVAGLVARTSPARSTPSSGWSPAAPAS
jgi:hypothetical protein